VVKDFKIQSKELVDRIFFKGVSFGQEQFLAEYLPGRNTFERILFRTGTLLSGSSFGQEHF